MATAAPMRPNKKIALVAVFCYHTDMKSSFELLNINSVRPFVKLILKYKKRGSVLDLGSAAGRHSLFLAKKGFRVVAIDNRSEFIAALKELSRLQKLKIKTVHTDLTKFTPDGEYDVLISTMVLHFIPYNLQKKMITQMQKHTKKNGLNVISSFTNKNKTGTRPFPLRTGELIKTYQKAGWKILYYDEGRGDSYITDDTGKKILGFWKEELIVQKPF